MRCARSTLLGLFVLTVGAVGVAGCSTKADPGAQLTNTGEVGLQLQVGATTVSSLSYSISNGTHSYNGNLDVGDASRLLAVIGGIAAGPGYTLTLSGIATNGAACDGSAGPFTVVANSTVIVAIQLMCRAANDAGSVKIEGTAAQCAKFASVSAAPPSGNQIQLLTSTVPAVPSPPVSLAWTITQGSGALSSSTLGNPVYTCAPSDSEVHLDVTMTQPPVAGCTSTFHLIIDCVTPTSCNGEGTSCDDLNACTQNDTCQLGMCAGSNVPAATACSQGGGTVCDGNGHCVQCLSASNCPGSDTECSSRTCVAQACGVASQPSGTQVTTQTAGDCHRNQCDGLGAVTSAVDDTDVPVDGNPCTLDVCSSGVPSNPFAPQRTSCGGAKMCDGNGACVDCIAATDCPGTDATCSHRTCVAGTCGTSASPYGATCTDSGGAICDGTGSCIPFTVRVARVGASTDGGALGINAAPVFIESRNVVSGSLVGTPIALPTVASGANQPLTVGGVALTDAQLSRSADEHYLIIPGYTAILGTSNPANSATVARVIGRIDAAGNVDTSTVFSNAFVASSLRSAVSSDGTTFWAAGLGANLDGGPTSGGTWTIQRGTTGGTQLSTTLARSLGITNGQLYVSGDIAPNLVLSSVGTGLPTTSGQSLTPLPGMPGSAMSPWGFVFFDRNASVPGIDTAYVANEVVGGGDAGASLRGIQKWVYNGTTWSLAATLNLPSPTGYRSLTGLVVGSTVTLVASTADSGVASNRLVVFVDDGVTAPRVLASSSTNTFYRGVALPPR